jgi:hypothetical protein
LFSNCFISNNIFNSTSFSLLPVFIQLGQSAITLKGVVTQKNTSVNIAGNQFINAAIKNGDSNYNTPFSNGITFTNVSNAIISGNTFSQLYSGQALDDTYYSMFLESSNHNTIIGNTYTGISNSSYGVEVGLQLIDSRRGIIRCNDFSNLKRGASFSNICDATGFSLNSLTNHVNALRLENENTVIGPQIAQYNSWPNQSTEEAIYSGVDQTSPMLFASRFVVPTDELSDSNSYWPHPRYPTANWFVKPNQKIDRVPASCVAARPISTDSISVLEQSLIDGVLPEVSGYTALEWDVKFDLYDLLYQNEGLHAAGSHAADFFDANATTTLGQLYQAYLQYAELAEYPSSVSSSIQTKQTELAGLVQDLRTLLEQENQTTNGQTLLQLQSQYADKIVQLHTNSINGSALIASHQSDRQDLIYALYTQLNQINPVSLPEENFKNLLVLLTNIAESGSNQAIQNQLAQIADQCRYTGGNAVAIAGATLGRVVAGDASTCNVANRNNNQASSATPTLNALTVSPNPVRDALTAYLPVSQVAGSINIYSVSGQLVCSKLIETGIQQTVLDVKTLQPGLYILELQHDGHAISRTKFVKANH